MPTAVPEPLTQALARLLHATPAAGVGVTAVVKAPVRTRAALHLLDWSACAAYGASTRTGRHFGQWWSGSAQTAQDHALLLGALGNVLEMDDVHRGAILHPGPVVIPAALACAAACGASSAALLDAIVRGYEAMIRVGLALGPAHYRHWHKTGTCGPFGAAAACASLLGLDLQQTAHALALAGSRTGGLWQVRHEDSMGKSWHNADAARAGWQAAALAQAGVTGPLRVLEGESGLFAATSPDALPQAVSTPAPEWKIVEVSFKPWPACRHAHAAMDALLALREAHPFDAASLVSIKVDTYADAVRFCDNPQPQTEIGARFSLQHALAMIVLHGRPQLLHFGAPHLTDGGVAALRQRVQVTPSARFEQSYPQHFGARVQVQLRDGSTIEQICADAWGDPEWPLAAADVADKARMLCHAAGHADAAVDTLLAACAGLARCGNDGGSGDSSDSGMQALQRALNGIGLSRASAVAQHGRTHTI